MSEHFVDWAPRGIDVTTPSTARMYDYGLGGKDNFQADREAAEKVFAVIPAAREIARINRVFLQRAVRVCAQAGISQFVDIGTGVPTHPAVHDVAHEVNPDARVAYVDNDPVALAHARALLGDMGTGRERVSVIDADMRQPSTIIENPQLQGFIDWDRPVAVMLLMMLHFATDDEDPEGVVSALGARMVPGSYLAISHVTDDAVTADEARRLEGVYKNATSPLTCRSGQRIRAMLSGFTLLEPGLVFLTDWRPDMPPALPTEPSQNWVYAALGSL